MNSVVIVICLLIIAGLIAILAIKRNDKGNDYAVLARMLAPVQGQQSPQGPSCPQDNSPRPIVEEHYPWRWRGRGWRWHHPRFTMPLVADPYNYYPQSLIAETCLNECCDYSRCSAGLGCNWKGIDNRWHLGTPNQCLAYRNCISSSTTKSDKEKNIECLGKAAVV